MLQGPWYLNRGDHDRKIRARSQRTDIDKYFFVNRKIKMWNQVPAEALATSPCKLHIFRNRFNRVIISEEKWTVFEGWWRNVQRWTEVNNGEWSIFKLNKVLWIEVKWNEVIFLGEGGCVEAPRSRFEPRNSLPWDITVLFKTYIIIFFVTVWIGKSTSVLLTLLIPASGFPLSKCCCRCAGYRVAEWMSGGQQSNWRLWRKRYPQDYFGNINAASRM